MTDFEDTERIVNLIRNHELTEGGENDALGGISEDGMVLMTMLMFIILAEEGPERATRTLTEMYNIALGRYSLARARRSRMN